MGYRSVWNFEKRKDLGRDLNKKPANDRISDCDLVHVAPFQLGEEIAKIHSGASRWSYSLSGAIVGMICRPFLR